MAVPFGDFPGIENGREGTVVRFFTTVTDRDVPGTKEERGGPVYSARKQAMRWYQASNPGLNSLDYTSLVLLPEPGRSK